MPRGRALRLLLRWSAVAVGIVVALRALWGAWGLPGEQYWETVGLTVAGLLVLVLCAAVPAGLLVLLRRPHLPRQPPPAAPAADSPAAGSRTADPRTADSD